MNLSSLCLKSFSLALCLGLVGCASAPKGTEAGAARNASPVLPQDFANIGVQQDHSSYQSAFCTNAGRAFPILFIVGDSTVHNCRDGRVGWGDLLGGYFDTNKIRVENHALAGRSSRTFITQGWWNLVLQESRPGDFLLLQMGDNDGGPLADTNRARGSIPGIGNEQKRIYNPVMHREEIVHTYGWYLRKYIADARAHGITPIICSPVPHVPRTVVQPGEVENFRYVRYAGEVATNQNVAFINLNRLVLAHYVGMKPAEVKAKYFTRLDNTHSDAAGAALNAACVVAGLKRLPGCPLKNYLRPAN